MNDLTFFSPRVDGLLQEWLSSPRWHTDRPSENARFYRFAAALMQEAGQPDIREVMETLKEAGSTWATDYDGCHGDARVQALCERLQVLYDFFGAHQEYPHRPALPPPEPLPLPMPAAISTASPAPPGPDAVNSAASHRKKRSPHRPPPQAQIELPSAILQAAPESKPAPDQAAPSGAAPALKKRGRRGNEVVVEQSEASGEFPSQERMEAFWKVVIRLHDLLVARRGESPPPAPSPKDTEALVAEMQRRAAEVLHAEEITVAEKRDLIGTIIDKVIPHRKDDGTVDVEIEWLK